MTGFEILNEAFPRLGEKVFNTWGSRECRTLLCDLINDTRGGTRQGFQPAVAAAIIRLLSSHDEQFKEFDDSDNVIIPFKSQARIVRHTVDQEGWPILFKIAVGIIGIGLLAGLAKAAMQIAPVLF